MLQHDVDTRGIVAVVMLARDSIDLANAKCIPQRPSFLIQSTRNFNIEESCRGQAGG